MINVFQYLVDGLRSEAYRTRVVKYVARMIVSSYVERVVNWAPTSIQISQSRGELLFKRIDGDKKILLECLKDECETHVPAALENELNSLDLLYELFMTDEHECRMVAAKVNTRWEKDPLVTTRTLASAIFGLRESLNWTVRSQ